MLIYGNKSIASVFIHKNILREKLKCSLPMRSYYTVNGIIPSIIGVIEWNNNGRIRPS